MQYLLATILTILCFQPAFTQDAFIGTEAFGNECYSDQQINDIKRLLSNTKHSLEDRLNNVDDNESYSRAIMTDSYKFAKGYSQIMDLSSVPFDVLIKSTTFVGCWAENEFEGAGNCWEAHIQNITDSEMVKLNN